MSTNHVLAKLGEVEDSEVIVGRFGLVRSVNDLASAAVPVSSSIVYNVVPGSQNINAKSYEQEKKILQVGSFDQSLLKRWGIQNGGTLNVYAGYLGEFMDILYPESYGTTVFGKPLDFPSFPLNHMEFILKSDANEHLKSYICQDMKWKPPPVNIPDDVAEVPLTWESSYDVTEIYPGYKLVFDVWAGNDVLTSFTPSSTPIKITDITVSGRESWDYDYAFFIKERLSTQLTGTRVTCYTITPGTPVIETTGTTPATGTLVSMLYIAADT